RRTSVYTGTSTERRVRDIGEPIVAGLRDDLNNRSVPAVTRALTATMILDYSASMQPRMPCQIPRRASYALAVTVLCAAATGCLTVDGTLDADDTGTLAISFTAPPEASEASVRSMIAAPGISVESFALGAERKVSAKVKVEDLATIGFMKVLQGVTVTRTAEGDDQVLSITGTNLEKSIADKNVPGPKVRITLPGKVLEA